MIKFVFKVHKTLDCPAATKDLKLNTKNRDAAIHAEHIQYGPLNVDEPGDYWKDIAEYWNTTEKAAKKSLCGNCVAFDISSRMKDCMPGETSDDDGELGYCWMHHFKCHSARSCRTWAKGGPIKEDDKSVEWQEKNKDSLDEKKKKKKKKKKKGDRCTRIAKRKYDVWPSAYASGAVVKCRQGKIWKGVKENFSITDAELKGIVFEETEKVLKEKCWDGYVQKGMKKKGGKDVPNCVLPEELTDETLDSIHLPPVNKPTKKCPEDHTLSRDTGKCEPNRVRPALREKKKKKAKTDYSKEKKSGLHGWFSRQGGKGKSKGWVDCNTCRKDKKTGKKTCKSCGRKKGEKRAKYPSCRPTPSACGTKGKGKKWGKTK